MKTELFTACDHALAAAANGLYQGVILTVAVALALRCLGRTTNAATRHSIWMVTLFLLPAIMVAHWWLDSRPVHQSGSIVSEPERGTESPSLSLIIPTASGDLLSPGSSAPKVGLGQEKEANFILADLPKTQIVAGPPVPWADHAEPAILILPKDQRASVPVEHKSASIWSKALTLLSTSVRDRFQWALERLTKPVYWDLGAGFSPRRIAVLAALAGWLSVFLSKIILLAWRLHELRKLKQNSLPANEELTRLFENLRYRLGIKRPVRVRVADVYRSPVVLGFVHPVVLLPPLEVLPGDSEEMEPILRHELAHVRRADDWANLTQHLVQAAFFFHPGVWWICRQLALDREIACDDQVLQQVRQPRAYALILANLASRMKRCPPMLAPGASTNKSQLQQRINMILDTKRNASPSLAKTRLGFVTSAAALLAGLAIYSGPRLVLAETPTPETAENAPQPEVSADVTPSVAVSVSSSVSANNAITVAQADDPIAPVPPVEAGPRYKPDATPALPAPPAANVAPLATPAPPMIVAIPGPAGTPAIITAPRPVALPPGPGAPGFALATSGHGGDDGSIERRLDRLERQVQSLLGQQSGPHPKPKGPDWNWNWNMDEKQKADMKAMAERESARAEREAKRAQEEVKRANKDMERAMKEQSERAHGMQKESSQRQLEGLRRARENLERQMQKLDSQIEKLEHDQEKLQEEQERRSELEQEQKEKAAVAEVETQ